MNDVVIVGGGPTGLMLACELKLGGVAAVVLEREAAPTGIAKALGVGGRTLDLLELRGLLGRFEAAAAASPSLVTDGAHSVWRLFHFGGVPLDVGRLEGPPPRFLPLFQSTTERLLAERAAELGVEVLRGHRVVDLAAHDDSVTLTVEEPAGRRRIEARYVVGCDGAHSEVRKLAGVGFPGTEPSQVLRLGDVRLPPAATPGGSPWSDGRAPVVRLADGWSRIITKEPLPADLDRAAPMTFRELRDSVARVFHLELPEVEVRSLGRFTDTSRLAEQYRKGRVLLAGDAAHVHLPAGGPGLNAGLNDAFNLGWKLAAEVRGDAPPGLLDSYHDERHPVGKRLMMHTRAQGAMLHPTLESMAVRELLGGLLRHPPVLRDVVDLLQGTDVVYDVAGGEPTHPLAGGWLPDLSLETGPGPRRLRTAMRSARGLFVELAGRAALAEPVTASGRRIDAIAAPLRQRPADAILVRPDGHVAWAAAVGESDASARDGLSRALARWF